MGIDSRGVDRGKCSCGDCEEFESGSGSACSYCGCLPVRHAKRIIDSTATVSTQSTAEQERSSSIIWEDESLGWFPHPKGNFTQFSNSLLPVFYESYWRTCYSKERFRLEFTEERKRQWELRQSVAKIKKKVSFITSDNPAAAGKYMHGNFQVNSHDSITITNNKNGLLKVKNKIEELICKVKEHDNALFMPDGIKLKPGFQAKHKANQDVLKDLSFVQSTVLETLDLLENAHKRVERIFPRRGKALKRNSRMKKQNRRKAEKRKKRRYLENEEAITAKILKVDIETIRNDDYVIDNDDLVVTAISNMKAFEMRYLLSILDNTPATTHSVQTIKRFLSPQCLNEFEKIKETRSVKQIDDENCEDSSSTSDTEENTDSD